MSLSYAHAWTLKASPADVFRALTDPAELTKWFAQGAQVEPRVGGVYRFWGRHTLGTPPQDAARQTITRFEPDDVLAYDWPIDEVDTDVTMELEVVPKGTKLSLTHNVSGDLRVPRQRELIDDHWRLAMSNLMCHLAGGEGITLPDYFDPHPEVRITMPVAAPPAVVFRALVEPERVNRWFGSKAAVVEPHQGGRYQLGWNYKLNGVDVEGGPTHVIELIPDTKLVLDWRDWRGDATVTGQTITFLLEPDLRGGTTLTFAHAGFGRTTDQSDNACGWRHFLGSLEQEVTKANGAIRE